jgi:hypothetical protein
MLPGREVIHVVKHKQFRIAARTMRPRRRRHEAKDHAPCTPSSDNYYRETLLHRVIRTSPVQEVAQLTPSADRHPGTCRTTIITTTEER